MSLALPLLIIGGVSILHWLVFTSLDGVSVLVSYFIGVSSV